MALLVKRLGRSIAVAGPLLATAWLTACGSSSPPHGSSGASTLDASGSGAAEDGSTSDATSPSGESDASDAATSSPSAEGGKTSLLGCGIDFEAGAPQQVDAGISPLPNGATQYQGTFNSPPSQTDTSETTDAPLLGNGDVGVAVLGTIDAMTFILGKTEFWSLSQLTAIAMSRLSLSIPGMKGASYGMTESISTGEVAGKFTLNGNAIATTSWVQATDTTNNYFFTQFTYTGSGSQNVTVSLAVGNDNNNPTSTESMADVLYQDVAGDNSDTVGGYTTHKVRIATRAVGVSGTVANNALTFTLTAGQTVTLATSIMSNFDSMSYQTQAIGNVSALMPSDVTTYNASHLAWWDAFHRTSYISIADKTIEKEYYASLYILASASRTGEVAPGLWGPWIMTNPAWGYYTMDYNQECQFYGALATNHVELADSYDSAVIAWIPNAQKMASTNAFSGALYSVGIGLLPGTQWVTGIQNTINLKSVGAWAATDMIMHYYYAPSLTYAQSIYPTLQQMALFWEKYLVEDGGVYTIINDAQQEGDTYPQTNGIMSLGLVRFLLQGCIDISTALNVDAMERATWQNLLMNLAPFPTYTGCPTCTNGETVFRWTSVGRDWDTTNAIGIQHIFPGSQIGLSSDSNLLQIANNMIGAMARWDDGNGTPTFYPAAARVGYSPGTIFSQLDGWIQNNTYPNLHIHTGGGGIENANTVPTTVAEMMLQSFQGTIRVFPNWPSGSNAKFADLRAYGAFIVSSAIQSNAVQYVGVMSEDGGPFTLSNPWPNQSMVVYRNGVDVGLLSGASVTIQTCANDILFVAPQGTSYASILTMVNTY